MHRSCFRARIRATHRSCSRARICALSAVLPIAAACPPESHLSRLIPLNPGESRTESSAVVPRDAGRDRGETSKIVLALPAFGGLFRRSPAGACCPAGTATPHPHCHDHDASAAGRAAAQHGNPLHRQRADQHASARAGRDRGLLDARDRPARHCLFRGLHPRLPQRPPPRAPRRPHQDLRDAFQRRRRHGAGPCLPDRPDRLGRAALLHGLRIRRPLRRDRELAERPRRHRQPRRHHVGLHVHLPLRADGRTVPADGLRPGRV